MSKQQPRINADRLKGGGTPSIFAGVSPPEAKAPATADESARTKTIVSLDAEHYTFLDAVSAASRVPGRTGRTLALNRTQIIRATIAAVAKAGIDFAGVSSEDEATARILAKLKPR